MADDVAEEGSALASWPARRRPGRRSRAPRRAIIPPLIAVAVLALAHMLFGSAQPVAALFVSAALLAAALISLLVAGPRYVTLGMALGAGALWTFGVLGWAGPLERATPHLAALFGAGAAWTAAYVCARQRKALDVAWAGLVWTSFVYCAWMFFRHIAAGFDGVADAATFEGVFASAAEASVLFGLLALLGSSRVSHVLKQIDAEAVSRSEGVEKLMRDGLGGFLLLGFSVTCLILAGSRVGMLITGGVILLHMWWDSRTLVRNADRGHVRKLIGRVTPLIAFGMIAAGLWFAFVEPETAGLGRPGAALWPALQRLEVYWSIFLQHPVFGVGLGGLEPAAAGAATLDNARVVLAPGGAQNVALTWLVEIGLAGASTLALFIVAMVVQLFRGLGSRHAPRTFLRLALAASLLMLLHGASDSSLSLPSLAWLYAFLMGAGCGVASWKRGSSADGAQKNPGKRS